MLPSAADEVPLEIWQKIAALLEEEQVWRLRMLNRSWLSVALDGRYSSLRVTIPPTQSRKIGLSRSSKGMLEHIRSVSSSNDNEWRSHMFQKRTGAAETSQKTRLAVWRRTVYFLGSCLFRIPRDENVRNQHPIYRFQYDPILAQVTRRRDYIYSQVGAKLRQIDGHSERTLDIPQGTPFGMVEFTTPGLGYPPHLCRMLASNFALPASRSEASTPGSIRRPRS